MRRARFSLADAANGVTFDIAGTGTSSSVGLDRSGATMHSSFAGCGMDLFNNGNNCSAISRRNRNRTLPTVRGNGVFDDPKNGGNGDGSLIPVILFSRPSVVASNANHDGISHEELQHATVFGRELHQPEIQNRMTGPTSTESVPLPCKGHPDGPASDVGRTAYDVFSSGFRTPPREIPAASAKFNDKAGMLAPVGVSR